MDILMGTKEKPIINQNLKMVQKYWVPAHKMEDEPELNKTVK